MVKEILYYCSAFIEYYLFWIFMGINDGSEGDSFSYKWIDINIFLFIARMPTISSSCRNKELIPVEIEGI